jgi:hypothetical protein
MRRRKDEVKEATEKTPCLHVIGPTNFYPERQHFTSCPSQPIFQTLQNLEELTQALAAHHGLKFPVASYCESCKVL